MAIDVSRVVQAAIEAATQGSSSDGETKAPKPRLSAGRALLLGAGLVTVGRLAAPKGREMLGSLQQRLEEFESEPEDEQQTDEEYDDEPEGEGDEDFDEEDDYDDEGDYDDEPEDEGDEDSDEEDDYDDEPEDEGDEDSDEQEDEDERPRPRRRTRSRAGSRS